MKLVVCIVHSRDRGTLSSQLVQAGFKFTISSSQGGYLGESSTLFHIGIEDEQTDALLDLIAANCKTREQDVNVTPMEGAGMGAFMTGPVRVSVGGAVVFVLPVERFERL